jgi:two-component system sensor histidine kinase KdpD
MEEQLHSGENHEEGSDFDSIRGIIRLLTDNSLSLAVRLNRSLDFVLGKIQASRGSIMLWERENKGLRVAASTNPDILGLLQAVDPQSISGYVFQTSVPLLIRDINKSKEFKPGNGRDSYRTDSLLCVPLLGSKQQAIGVINCSDREGDTQFTEDDSRMLRDYAAWISPLVENSCLVDSLGREKERYKALVRELELKQKELLITHTERTELVQMVVHDFKSPLSAVISNLDLLRYMGISEEQENILDTARNGASKLFEMINDFLQVARLDQWQEQKGRLQPTELLPQVQKSVQEAAPTAEAREINLTLDSGGDVRVIAETSLLAHLLSNLLSNAIKYTPQGGEVLVYWDVLDSKRAEDEYDRIVKICVRDSGPGVPDELKKKIFDRFSRADRDKDIQGTGVGLFICNRIVTIMHGRIWVEDAPEGGSIFCVTLYAPREESDAGQG